jgi:hypothetical protein
MSQRRLSYSASLSRSRASRLVRVAIGTAIGVAVSLPALLAALVSAGAGHGHYEAARALYPVPLLLTRYMAGLPESFLLIVVCAQFPLYGLLIGWPRGRRMLIPLLVIAIVHASAAVACFSGAVPSFS